MTEVEGYVERITFRNEENGYTVLYIVNPAKDDEEHCCVGYFSYIGEGEYIVVKGKEIVHKSYGPQIQVESYEEKQPGDAIAIEKYLGSGTIKGIGPALAARNSPMITPTRDSPILTLVVLSRVGMDPGSTTLKKISLRFPPSVRIRISFSGST